MADKNGFFDLSKSTLSRRTALKGIAAGAGLALAPGFVRYSQAQSSAPIKIGFQSHRTGIGAAYGRWYEKTSAAAVKAINDAGGISGRKVELVIEDDGTDPARGAEVVGKFATQHKTDIIFGTLFSHVVIGSAPAAGENKIPYFVVSEGHHVASTKLNRYVFQPGITDVKSQIQSMAPW
ncbi:MAG: ABC transporter substrate-binding protein, partial [Mesorhizobium sp.]